MEVTVARLLLQATIPLRIYSIISSTFLHATPKAIYETYPSAFKGLSSLIHTMGGINCFYIDNIYTREPFYKPLEARSANFLQKIDALIQTGWQFLYFWTKWWEVTHDKT